MRRQFVDGERTTDGVTPRGQISAFPWLPESCRVAVSLLDAGAPFRYNWKFQRVLTFFFVRKWRNWQTR